MRYDNFSLKWSLSQKQRNRVVEDKNLKKIYLFMQNQSWFLFKYDTKGKYGTNHAADIDFYVVVVISLLAFINYENGISCIISRFAFRLSYFYFPDFIIRKFHSVSNIRQRYAYIHGWHSHRPNCFIQLHFGRWSLINSQCFRFYIMNKTMAVPVRLPPLTTPVLYNTQPHFSHNVVWLFTPLFIVTTFPMTLSLV